MSRKEREMWNISVLGAVHLGVVVMVDVIFHFMYIVTIPNDMKLLRHTSDWALGPPLHPDADRSFTDFYFCRDKIDGTYLLFPVGLAYFNLVYDWVKAAVMFGVINTVSRLDHLDPPKPPKCITVLYVFAET